MAPLRQLLRRRGLPHRGVQACGIDDHSELLKIVRVAKLMQREGVLDGGLLAGDVHGAVDRFLGHLQRERRL